MVQRRESTAHHGRRDRGDGHAFIWGDHKALIAVHGRAHLSGLSVKNLVTGEERVVSTPELFVMIWADGRNEWLPAEVARHAQGYVLAGRDAPFERKSLRREPYLLETAVLGVFAAGDVRLGQAGGSGRGQHGHYLHPSVPGRTNPGSVSR